MAQELRDLRAKVSVETDCGKVTRAMLDALPLDELAAIRAALLKRHKDQLRAANLTLRDLRKVKAAEKRHALGRAPR